MGGTDDLAFRQPIVSLSCKIICGTGTLTLEVIGPETIHRQPYVSFFISCVLYRYYMLITFLSG